MNKTDIMNMIQEIQETISEFEEVTESEDFNPYDASGGNFDDAYEMGLDHGRAYGKLSILKLFLNHLSE